MALITILLVFAVLGVALCAENQSFLDIHLGTIKQMLQRREGEIARLAGLIHKDKDPVIDAHSLKFLMDIQDGQDSICDDACVWFIREKYLKGQSFMNWEWFADTITKIYGDAITNDPFQPQELHLALTGDSSKMNIMYVTMQELASPFVQWQPKPTSGVADWSSAATQSMPATTSTYRVPQKWWPIFTGTIYSSNMINLVDSASYVYRVGGAQPDGTIKYSADFTFKAAPAQDPSRQTVVATLADHGTFELLGFAVTDAIHQQQAARNIDLVHVSGDLSYAGLSSAVPALNIDKEDEFEHVWDLLFIQNQPVAATVPWMVTNGNHERFYDWAAFQSRFTMPSNQPQLPSNGSFWYTYEYGNSRWISLSSEHDLTEGSPQQIFMIAALEYAKANRNTVPWVVVSIHKPMYCSADGWGNAEGMSVYQSYLEETMIKYDVDLMITGHLHVYERVHPTKNGQVTVYPKHGPSLNHLNEKSKIDTYYSNGFGPVQIVQGNAGGMQAETWMHPQPAWSGVRFGNGMVPKNESKSVSMDIPGIIEKIKHIKDYDYKDTYGFGVATFYNRTHMFYENVPVTSHTVGHDSFWIVKRQ